jgi:RNA recognition motif-containing protein
MSLFIGNVSKKVTAQEFEAAFRSYGNCKIDLRVLIYQTRKDMHLYSTTVRDVQKRPNNLYRIQILVG